MKLTLSIASCILLCSNVSLGFVAPISQNVNLQNEASMSSLKMSDPNYDPKAFEDWESESKVQAKAAPKEEKKEEEFHPVDPASTTPQLLAALWHLIARGVHELKKGESFSVKFPEMESTFTQNPTYLERLMGHFDVCKDVCDDFGVNTILQPMFETRNGVRTVVGFTVKSYKDPNKVGTFGQEGDMDFAPDPFFDNDDWDLLEEKIKAAAAEEAELDGDDGESLEGLPEIEDRIPDNDDVIVDVTKKWVNKIMSDMGICPFAKSAEMAGLPIGQVYYTVDRSTLVEDMYAVYWNEAVRVEQTNQKELSTTLLVAPEFLIDNVEMFENFSNTLTQPLESLHVEDLLQLVFFHPEWAFRDGGERSGEAAAANYARRSPWPMINILRTNQVRRAQKGIPTGLVYQQNEKMLTGVGARSLEKMLRMRDWTEIADLKVDRRDLEALRVAQDLQETGVVAEKDRSLKHDAAPSVTKLDSRQIEGGDIVNVVLQALEKRLGAGEEAGKLSGAETSAAMMASDFLLDHLEEIEQNPPQSPTKVNPMAQVYFDTDDIVQSVTEEDESSVLFGGGGIASGDEEDSMFGNAADPRNFY